MRKKEYCTLLKLSHKHTHRWLKTDDSIYKYERKNNKKKSNPTFFLQIKYDRFFNALLNWLNLGVYPILINQTFLFFCFNFVNFAMRYPLILGWVTIRCLVGSTDQAESNGFYFSIAWKSTEQPSFLWNCSVISAGPQKYKHKIGHNTFTF